MIFVLCDVKVPFFIKLAAQGGVNYLKIRGARGVQFMENTPWDMDNIVKKCRFPFFMLFGNYKFTK